MENANTLASRVKQARKLRGLSQAQLAKTIGTGQSTIASIENGRNQGSSYLVKIAEALRVSVNWLANGEGPMDMAIYVNKIMTEAMSGRRNQAVDPALDSARDFQLPPGGDIVTWDHPDELPEDENRVWIDRYDLMCSAGDGMAQWEVRQKSALPFTRDFFRAIKSRPEDCRLAITRGDSMEPYLFDHDMIMIDLSKKTPRDGNIYAICFEDEMLVKQIFKQAGGALTLHSYNPKYPDRTVPPAEGTRFEIVGQVIYRSGSGLPSY